MTHVHGASQLKLAWQRALFMLAKIFAQPELH
jgi:hypothetical protein